ncbi:MAG: hypothetical protein Q4C70_04295 [Planctomycetia bacterium]|nr:hypothetical protein [Planctomycetia bacterium]
MTQDDIVSEKNIQGKLKSISINYMDQTVEVCIQVLVSKCTNTVCNCNDVLQIVFSNVGDIKFATDLNLYQYIYIDIYSLKDRQWEHFQYFVMETEGFISFYAQDYTITEIKATVLLQ